jgi:cell division protein FtsZ
MPFKILTDLYFSNQVKTIPLGAVGFFECLGEIERLINSPGLIKLDQVDVLTVVKGAKEAAIVKIEAGGGNKTGAIEKELAKLIPEDSAKMFTGAIFFVIGGEDLTLADVKAVAESIYQMLSTDATIIFGATIDEEANDYIKLMMILTK